MPSGSELEVLKIIDEEGGSTVIQVISKRMRVEPSYARLLCNSLGRADYIDVLASGICRITP
ncbi:hypothetical protein L6386_00175, partial [bacterium]|nr:hypothetical protein [bacterium]